MSSATAVLCALNSKLKKIFCGNFWWWELAMSIIIKNHYQWIRGWYCMLHLLICHQLNCDQPWAGHSRVKTWDNGSSDVRVLMTTETPKQIPIRLNETRLDWLQLWWSYSFRLGSLYRCLYQSRLSRFAKRTPTSLDPCLTCLTPNER